MKQNSGKKNNIKRPRGPKIQHLFHGIREPVFADAGSNTTLTFNTNASGSGTVAYALNSQGLTSVAISGSTFVKSTLDPPHLKWLYNNASNFGSFRVLRAKLIFVGNQGTTTMGTVSMFGSKDCLDCGAGLNTAFVQGNCAKSYDLASAGTRELSLNLPVDSSWKKVSSYLSLPGNVSPFGGVVGAIVPCNTANDLSFCGFAVQVIGAPATMNVGTVFLDYDIEFKDPMSVTMNV